jgi:probable HAF family extracellular repeat protein
LITGEFMNERVGLIALLLLGGFATGASGGVQYTVTDLGTLGGSESFATGINNSGQVVGYCYNSNNATNRAFLYSGGSMQALGTLGGASSEAYGINSSGQVVGYEVYASSSYAFRTAANEPINPATDNLGSLGGGMTWGNSGDT